MEYCGPSHLKKGKKKILNQFRRLYIKNLLLQESIHLQSTISTVGDKVVGGFPVAPEPDNRTSRPFSGRTWRQPNIYQILGIYTFDE
jgi:hypothetical protein